MFGLISKLFSCSNRPKVISAKVGDYEYSVGGDELFRSTIAWWGDTYHRIYEQIGIYPNGKWVPKYRLCVNQYALRDSDDPWERPDAEALEFISETTDLFPEMAKVFEYHMPENIAKLLTGYYISSKDNRSYIRYGRTDVLVEKIHTREDFLKQVPTIIKTISRIGVNVHSDNPIVSTTPYIENIWKYEAKTSIMDFEFASTPKCLYQYCTTENRWIDHGDNVLRLNFASIRDMVAPTLSPVFVANIAARNAIPIESRNGVIVVIDATDIGSSCAVGCIWNYISEEWEILPEPTSIPLIIATVGDTNYVWSLTKQLWMLMPKTSKKDN